MSLARKEFRNPNTNILQNKNPHAQINCPGRTKVNNHVNQWIIQCHVRSDGSSFFKTATAAVWRWLRKLDFSTCNIIIYWRKNTAGELSGRDRLLTFRTAVRLGIGCSGFLAGISPYRIHVWKSESERPLDLDLPPATMSHWVSSRVSAALGSASWPINP